jgi:hypothetical protein
MSDFRRFITEILVGKLKFRIAYITYDGYGSLESVQELQYSGIRCEQRSVEDNQSQETMIDDFIGNRIFKTYRHDVWRREARNLIREEETGRINHPEKDYDRHIIEGKEDGSDDVWKASVQAVLNCTQKLKLGRGVVF